MIDTLYVYQPTGFVGDAITQTAATLGVSVKRGDNLQLYVVFHNGVAPIELPADGAGTLSVKAVGGFAQSAVLTAGTWTKQPSAAGGYLFAVTISGGAVDPTLGNAPWMAYSAEIAWTTGGVKTTTPTFGFTVLNNLNR